jgi:uncharacterized protein (DUF305 family)
MAVLGAALLTLAALPAAAQQHDMSDMPGMHHAPAAGAGAQAPASREFQAEMERMHAGMAVPYTGDADRDFVAGMVPHHQGAIEMARTELRYGHDPVLRKLAQQIILAQDREIALMRRWQATAGAH